MKYHALQQNSRKEKFFSKKIKGCIIIAILLGLSIGFTVTKAREYFSPHAVAERLKQEIQRYEEFIHSLKTKLKDYKIQFEEEENTIYLPQKTNSQGVAHPNVITPIGSNDYERTKNFVVTHCSNSIRKIWDTVYKATEAKGIKGYMPFAIAFADTGCGNAIITKNNFGNVGNTDGGRRMGFNTAFEGMMAITNTLNNKYIKGIDNVAHLSGGGRKIHGSKYPCGNAPMPYKCYATSMENWHNNISRALYSMTAQDVNGNLEFRI